MDIIKIKMLPALIIGIKIKRKIHKWCVISCDPFHSRIETHIELGLGLTPYTKIHVDSLCGKQKKCDMSALTESKSRGSWVCKGAETSGPNVLF